ncbi:MAG TPA: GNAT family N-acetyltransferase [Gemmatimonadaceae bacterium]|nr:GNAT family N-acetyltransferase [Gemmatimonadaceae bacterium]
MSPVLEVVRTYLELRSLAQLRASPIPDAGVRVVRRASITAEHYRRLYRAVGDAWYWHDRNAWSDQRLLRHLAAPDVAVWECLVHDETAGFFELQRNDDGSVEIAYFGLVAAFMGRGIGKALLSRAAEEAWNFGASRVWLHTCTLDSPQALPNYRARGFEEVRTEKYVVQIPETHKD